VYGKGHEQTGVTLSDDSVEGEKNLERVKVKLVICEFVTSLNLMLPYYKYYCLEKAIYNLGCNNINRSGPI